MCSEVVRLLDLREAIYTQTMLAINVNLCRIGGVSSKHPWNKFTLTRVPATLRRCRWTEAVSYAWNGNPDTTRRFRRRPGQGVSVRAVPPLFQFLTDFHYQNHYFSLGTLPVDGRYKAIILFVQHHIRILIVTITMFH